MPRIVDERLVGYTLAVRLSEATRAAEDGHVLHDGKGQPKTVDVAELVFTDPASGHRVRIAVERRSLIEALTGGVVVAEAPG